MGSCYGSCYTGLETRNSANLKLSSSSYLSLQLRNDAVLFSRQKPVCSSVCTVYLLTTFSVSEDSSASAVIWNTTIMKTTLLGPPSGANLYPWTDRWLSKNCPLAALCCCICSDVMKLRIAVSVSTDPMLTQCRGLASACKKRALLS